MSVMDRFSVGTCSDPPRMPWRQSCRIAVFSWDWHPGASKGRASAERGSWIEAQAYEWDKHAQAQKEATGGQFVKRRRRFSRWPVGFHDSWRLLTSADLLP